MFWKSRAGPPAFPLFAEDGKDGAFANWRASLALAGSETRPHVSCGDPGILLTRSVISVISRIGSTSVVILLSSPARSGQRSSHAGLRRPNDSSLNFRLNFSSRFSVLRSANYIISAHE